jgi:hypothetical protein
MYPRTKIKQEQRNKPTSEYPLKLPTPHKNIYNTEKINITTVIYIN